MAAAPHADFSLIPAANPAAAASASVLSTTPTTFTAMIAGQNAAVVSSGLAPGFVALGQVNLDVPAAALSGGGSTSNVVKIQVR